MKEMNAIDTESENLSKQITGKCQQRGTLIQSTEADKRKQAVMDQWLKQAVRQKIDLINGELQSTLMVGKTFGVDLEEEDVLNMKKMIEIVSWNIWHTKNLVCCVYGVSWDWKESVVDVNFGLSSWG